MKRLTATFRDDVKLDITELFTQAIDIKVETLADPVVPNSRAKSSRHQGEVSARQSIMEHFSPEATFTRSQARTWVMARGYSENSAGSSLGRLIAEKKVRFLGDGKYQFIAP